MKAASSSALDALDLRVACAGVLEAIQERGGETEAENDGAPRSQLQSQSPSPSLSTTASSQVSIILQWACASTPSSSQDELLSALAELLVLPHLVNTRNYAEALATHARPLLVELSVRAFEAVQRDDHKTQHGATNTLLYAYALLLCHAPELYP